MGRFEKVLNNLKERRERVLNGLYNCVPFPFPRFRRWVPGVEKGKYIVVTANQKVGKSKFCDYLFIYEPLFFALEHPELRLKVLYFTLEMSPDEKYNEFLCHLLFRLDGLQISPTDLKSTEKENPISEDILKLLETDRYQRYIKAFEKMVTYIDDIRNPTGINKCCRDYALSHGHLNYTKVMTKDSVTGDVVEMRVVDVDNPYTADDPEEHRIVIIDNASNLTNEKEMKKMETIDRMSKYGIQLRNQLKYIFVLIQHQAQAQEGIENQKLNRLKPSSDGLADCKTTTRDANMVIGLYSPFKYGLKEYEGYDITRFRNHIRFMEVIEDRDYGANGQICPLFFDGAVSTFNELPLPTDTRGIEQVYSYLDARNKKPNKAFLSIGISKTDKRLHKWNMFSKFATLLRNIKSES